jgi:hypothetical protein
VQALLDKYGWFWWSNPATPFGTNGIADMMAVRPGVFMVIETKHLGTSHGKKGPTALQLGFLNSVKAANHFAFVVNETNLFALEKFLLLFEDAAKLQAMHLEVPIEIGGELLNQIAELTQYPALMEPNQ